MSTERVEVEDEMFEALANAVRRRVLLALLWRGESAAPLEVPEDVPIDGTPARQLRVELHHVHLPKLARMGYVTWHEEAGKVSPGPAFDEIVPMLQWLDGVWSGTAARPRA